MLRSFYLATSDYGTYPIDYKVYKKALSQYEQDKLKQIEHDLKKTIVGFYAPKSTRWHRNHTDVAEWYWLCIMDPRTKLI